MNGMARSRAVGLVIGTLLVAACSAGDQPPAETTPNQPSAIIADSGPDQSVFLGTLVTLNGSKSTNANQTGLTYAWTLTTPPGSKTTLSDPTLVNPTLTVDVEGTYEATLVVTDAQNTTEKSATDTTIVIASKTNPPPVANIAATSRSVFTRIHVLLNGSHSSDANKDPLTFRWTFADRPSGSSASLQDATTVAPSFTPDVEGDYTIRLIVNDGTSNSTPASVTIHASNKPSPIAAINGSRAPAPLFVPPNPGNITFNSTGSQSQPSGTSLEYSWTIASSSFTPAPKLNGGTTSNQPSVLLTEIPQNAAGTVDIQLKVIDPNHPGPEPNFSMAKVLVVVGPLAIIRVSGSTCTITKCESVKVQQNSSASIELDGSASQGPPPPLPGLTYEWAGATPTSNPAVATFTPDVLGPHTVGLTVGNGRTKNERSVTLEVVTGPVIKNPIVTIKGANNQDLTVNSVPPNTSATLKASIEGTTTPVCVWTFAGGTINPGSCSPTDGATAQIAGLPTEGWYEPTLLVREGSFVSQKGSFRFAVNKKPQPRIDVIRNANTTTSCMSVDLTGSTNPPDGFLSGGVTWKWSINPSVVLTDPEKDKPQRKQFSVKDTAEYSVTLDVTEKEAPADSGSNSATVSVDLSQENKGHNLYDNVITDVTSQACADCHAAGTHDTSRLSSYPDLIGHPVSTTSTPDPNNPNGPPMITIVTTKPSLGWINSGSHTGRASAGKQATLAQLQQLQAFFATVGCLNQGDTKAGH